MTDANMLRSTLVTLTTTLTAIHDRYEAGEVPEQPEFFAEILKAVIDHAEYVLNSVDE